MRGKRSSYVCLVCRRQRRRCYGNCEIGRYFPVHRLQECEYAFDLFGLCHISKLMRLVKPHEKHSAAKSIIDEAINRRKDPVHGSLGVQMNLISQVASVQRELEIANSLLSFCREQEKLAGSRFPNSGETVNFPSFHEVGESSAVTSKQKEAVDEEKAPKGSDEKDNTMTEKDSQGRD